jgi:hypothetical protein
MAFEIINRIIAAKENITYRYPVDYHQLVTRIRELHTNNPQGTTTGDIDVHRGEGGNASALHFKHVVGTFQRIGSAAKVEGKVGQVGDFVTVNRVLSVPRFLGTDLSIKHFGDVRREDDE